jgi:acetyl-CoA acetyltransferase
MSYKPGSVAVVGAAETTQIGEVSGMSQMMLHADAALNAMADAGLGPGDIDGIACVGQMIPHQVAHYLGITPRWIDGTGVGGCSFMLHVRHAAAAIQAGYARNILITHGESGRSRINAIPRPPEPESLAGQFEAPYGPHGFVTLFTIPVLRYMKATGTTQEHLAKVSVVQREWAALNPRAMYRDPLTIEEVLASRLVAYPFHLLQCCLVTDGGGAIIVTSSERAADFASKPVYVLGSGESCETMMVSQMEDFTRSKGFRLSGSAAMEMAGITPADVDHLMIYDAFAHLPLYGLEALGFCKFGEAKDFIWEGHTRPGGSLPLNTNGGGLSYTHTGMYGMFALQESIRQVRGCAPAQVDKVSISVAHGAGGMFCNSGTIVFGSEKP